MPLYSVYLLRVLAILLIVNSHLAAFYPTPKLAFGGHLGNSIFYLISGYGLSLSFNKKPLTAAVWIKKRFIKLLVPLILILAMINIGDWQGFKDMVMYHLVWHKIEQLEYFIPVLIGLYLLFPPINRLTAKGRYVLIAALLILSGALFYLRVESVPNIPAGLPSEGIFFAINGLLCFAIGMVMANGERVSSIIQRPYIRAKLLSIVISAEILHILIVRYAPGYVYLNFYLNIICVVALLLLFLTFEAGWFTPGVSAGITAVASSSLAVYLVHFEAIRLVEGSQIAFPYSIALIFLNSFLWAYAATRLVSAATDKALGRFGI